MKWFVPMFVKVESLESLNRDLKFKFQSNTIQILEPFFLSFKCCHGRRSRSSA